MNILFRADASIRLGSGHIMRCLTLATALTPYASCEFICRDEPGNLIALLQQQGIKVHILSSNDPLDENTDAIICLARLSHDYDLLVVDHYQLTAGYCRQLRQRCRAIMVIDDLADRRHDCDLLLDQNLLPDSASRYQGLLPAHCISLLGPAYALLREEFYQPRNITPVDNRLLVFFGGSDEYNLTSQALQALQQLKLPVVTADIVIGASNPWRKQVSALCAALPNVKLHIQCDNMAKLMHQTRLMLGAGGASHWERCICGLPALIVTVADNQQATTAYLDQLGACAWLGQVADMSAGFFAEQLRYYLSQPARLDKMSQAAASLIPADAGTPQVVAALLSLVRS